jgi:hypothetical protein
MIKDIIKSINNNLLIYNNDFHNSLLLYYKNKKSIKHRIKEDVYELTGIIYYLLENKDKYKLGINLNVKPNKKKCYYRKKRLSLLELNNLEYCLNSNEINIKFNNKKNKNKIYLIFSDTDYDFNYNIKFINIISLTQLFGIENFNILKYINSDRHYKLLKTKEGMHSNKELQNYKDILANKPDYIINNFIVLSSMLLFILGTTTARDIDILIYNINDDININKTAEIMGERNVDYKLFNKNNLWYSYEDKREMYWMTQAYSYDWVKNSGANELEDFYFNSNFYFYVYGIKCVSLKMQIERLIRRNSEYAYVDLIGLSIHNNVNINLFKPDLCISNLRLRQGVKTILTDESYEQMIIKIVKYLKLWHDKIFSIDQIKIILPKCSNESYDKNVKKNSYDTLFYNLRIFHKFIKFYYLKTYCDKGILLDIGSNNLKNIKFWKQLHLTKIYSIEPSEDLYNEGVKRLNNDEFAKKNITFIRAVGEKDWFNGEAGLNSYSKNKIIEISKLKFDSITFEFTIHYMIYNSAILLKNIQNVSKKGTKIIIHCLHGEAINNKLLNKDKFIIYKGKEEVFSITKKYNDTDELKKISVYFKNVQGLDNIVDEYLVNISYIKKLFINYKLIESKGFIENYDDKFYMEPYELEISNLYITFVYECIND